LAVKTAKSFSVKTFFPLTQEEVDSMGIRFPKMYHAITAIKASAGFNCFINMLLYSIRELLLFDPVQGSKKHCSFLAECRNWTLGLNTTNSFELDAVNMWDKSSSFRNMFKPYESNDLSFSTIVNNSMPSYYQHQQNFDDATTMNHLTADIPSSNISMENFRDCIQEKYVVLQESQQHGTTNNVDINILFLSFRSSELQSNCSIPYSICLNHLNRGIVYQVSSVYYRSANNNVIAVILTKTFDGNRFKFLWQSTKRNPVHLKTEDSEVDEKHLLRFSKKIDKEVYYAEGIVFVRVVDQPYTVTSKFTDTLTPCWLSVIDRVKFHGGGLFGIVTGEIIKEHLLPSTGWLSDALIGNIFFKMQEFFKCQNIKVDITTQVLNESNIENTLKNYYVGEKDMNLMVCSSRYNDMNIWNNIYILIEEFLTEEFIKKIINLEFIGFLFLPVFVDESHWILLVVSFNQKTIFIVDSHSTEQVSDHTFLANVLLKFLTYKASQLKDVNELNIDENKWTIVMLPCVQQKDGVSCGIYVIMNAAKIMNQIRSDASIFQFELKHVEDPIGIYDKKEMKEVRKLISEYFYKQIEFKNLMQLVHFKSLN
jgi:hypothetical protein